MFCRVGGTHDTGVCKVTLKGHRQAGRTVVLKRQKVQTISSEITKNSVAGENKDKDFEFMSVSSGTSYRLRHSC